MVHPVVVYADAKAAARARCPRAAILTGALVLVGAFGCVLAAAPALLDLALAVAAAIAWCIWLEKCPNAEAAAPESCPSTLEIVPEFTVREKR